MLRYLSGIFYHITVRTTLTNEQLTRGAIYIKARTFFFRYKFPTSINLRGHEKNVRYPDEQQNLKYATAYHLWPK